MEDRSIVYTGITQAMSDQSCRDGDLSISHNIINQNGAMRPIIAPNAKFILNEGERLVYVHKGEGYKNYIISKPANIDITISLYIDGTVVCSRPVTSDITVHLELNSQSSDSTLNKSFLIKTGTYKDNYKDDETVTYTKIVGVECSIKEDSLCNYAFKIFDTPYKDEYEGWSKELVTRKQDVLYYFPDTDHAQRNEIISLGDRTFKELNSIGSSIVILLDEGLEYLRLSGKQYKKLGSRPPELDISFGLYGYVTRTGKLSIDCSENNTVYETNVPGVSFVIGSEVREHVTNQVHGKINEALKICSSEGWFTQPFYICYAYKLLGQSDYMVSAPILMEPVRFCTYPYVTTSDHKVSSKILKSFSIDAIFVKTKIDYRIKSSILKQLNEWSDIITSLDIYISSPIYLYDPNGQIGDICSGFYEGPSGGVSSSIIKPLHLGIFADGRSGTDEAVYGHHDIYKYLTVLDTPINERFSSDMGNCSTFYLYKSYKLNELKSFARIDDKIDLTNLETNIKLDSIEDYNSHDIITANKSVVYNGRLHLVGIKKKFYGFSPTAFVPYSTGVGSVYTSTLDNISYKKEVYTFKFTFLIKEDEQIVKVESAEAIMYDIGSAIFYPNPKAYQVLIERTNTDGKKDYRTIPLFEHPLLNCAYNCDTDYYAGYSDTYNTELYDLDIYSYDYNKVYTSDIGSIFNFPLSGRNTIGTGNVLNIGAVSKALSPGQFGQFPLYVFSTDGVFAMEVNPNTGLFSSVHLVSRDVCNNPDGLVQIDGAIVFTTERGVMLLEGSEVRSISAEMDGPSFNLESVQKLVEILNKENLLTEIGSITSFSEYLHSCQLAYDYPNARIILFRSDREYAYVYSLYSRTWATMSSNFIDCVEDYPNVYLQSNNGSVLDLFEKNDYDSGQSARVFLLSRPFKFGDDLHKTVNAVINRVVMRRNNDSAMVVFGSSDGLNYVPIGSAIGIKLSRLHGTPYRYFRIALIGEMASDEALTMTSFYITQKWRNRPR